MRIATLGQLQTDLLNRLGFGASGASAGVAQGNFFNALINAQIQLYWLHDWRHLIERTGIDTGAPADISTVAGQRLYTLPTAAEAERILNVYVNFGGVFRPMTPGIPIELYTNASNSTPIHYEIRAKLEVWPVPSAVHTIRMEYVKKLGAFSVSTDNSTLDADLIFLHALVNLKNHYNHPDAKTYSDQFSELLRHLSGRSVVQKSFGWRGRDIKVVPRPVIV